MKTKLSNNQHGIAHLMLILAVVVIATIGGVGYVVFSKNKDKANDAASLNVNSEAIEAECKKEYDDKDFCKFASNFSLDESYKVVFTTTSTEGTAVMTSEVNGKNSRMTMTQDGKELSATVSLDGTSYVKDMTDGAWTKYPATEQEASTADVKEDLDFGFDGDTESTTETDTTEIKKIGKEACGELTCFKYQYIDKSAPNDESFIWFDDEAYKMRRYTLKNAEGSSDMVYSYEAVTITAPSPVKEAPNYETMSPEELQRAAEDAMQQFDDAQ